MIVMRNRVPSGTLHASHTSAWKALSVRKHGPGENPEYSYITFVINENHYTLWMIIVKQKYCAPRFAAGFSRGRKMSSPCIPVQGEFCTYDKPCDTAFPMHPGAGPPCGSQLGGSPRRKGAQGDCPGAPCPLSLSDRNRPTSGRGRAPRKGASGCGPPPAGRFPGRPRRC